jgi:hypothetical protein
VLSLIGPVGKLEARWSNDVQRDCTGRQQKGAVWGKFPVAQSLISLLLGSLFSVAISSPFEVLNDNTPNSVIALIFQQCYLSFMPRSTMRSGSRPMRYIASISR